MRSANITLLLTALLLLALGCGGDDKGAGSGGGGKAAKTPPKPALRYQLEPGTTTRYRITSSTEMAGMMPVKQSQTRELTWAVKEVDADGNATVDITFDVLKAHLENPMTGVVDYDSSTADPEEEPHPAIAADAVFVGKTVSIKLTPRGEVLTASGAEKVFDEFAKGNPMAGMMEKMFSNDVVKGRMQTSIMKLPAEEMEAGGEWTDTLSTPLGMMGEVKMDLSNKIKSIDEVEGRRIATIENSAVIDTSAIKLPEDNPMASQMKLSDGKMSGECKFDMTTGQLVHNRAVTTMTMEIMGQSMEVTETKTIERIE